MKNKLLFTPGPLTTSETVKKAQVVDLGSRDETFINVVAEIRRHLLQIAGQSSDQDYTAVLMQGAGTFGVESVISSVLAPDGRLLVVINGAYGRRIAQMADILKIPTTLLHYPENHLPHLTEIDAALADDPTIKLVAIVHCETTTGIMNPLEEIAGIVRKHDRQLFVDAMSSFGAVPVNIAEVGITYLVSSANKCIEGVPGFSFILAEKQALERTKGFARTLSLDLYAQWQGLEKNGQFRFTPPVQSLLAFHQALLELEEEGGAAGRARRYQTNHQTLYDGMCKLGFRPYLDADVQSYIITTFQYPEHPNFDFEAFYNALSEQGFVIYPGKLTDADCFRLGNIGRMDSSDMQALVGAVAKTIEEMGIQLTTQTH